jgi:hypothetical protein
MVLHCIRLVACQCDALYHGSILPVATDEGVVFTSSKHKILISHWKCGVSGTHSNVHCLHQASGFIKPNLRVANEVSQTSFHSTTACFVFCGVHLSLLIVIGNT